MNNQWIKYAAGIFIGIATYRLLFKGEEWIWSLVTAVFIYIGTTLGMYIYAKWKAKKST